MSTVVHVCGARCKRTSSTSYPSIWPELSNTSRKQDLRAAMDHNLSHWYSLHIWQNFRTLVYDGKLRSFVVLRIGIKSIFPSHQPPQCIALLLHRPTVRRAAPRPSYCVCLCFLVPLLSFLSPTPPHQIITSQKRRAGHEKRNGDIER